MPAIQFEHPFLNTTVTFSRGSEVFIVKHDGNVEFVLTHLGLAPQVLRLSDPITAMFFQADLDRELRQAGWAAELVEPEAPAAGAIVRPRASASPN
jgi:hypothetical protein